MYFRSSHLKCSIKALKQKSEANSLYKMYIGREVWHNHSDLRPMNLDLNDSPMLHPKVGTQI